MKSFEEVKPSIIQVLEGQFEADVRKKKIEEVTSAKNIKTDNDAVSELFKSLQP